MSIASHFLRFRSWSASQHSCSWTHADTVSVSVCVTHSHGYINEWKTICERGLDCYGLENEARTASAWMGELCSYSCPNEAIHCIGLELEVEPHFTLMNGYWTIYECHL